MSEIPDSTASVKGKTAFVRDVLAPEGGFRMHEVVKEFTTDVEGNKVAKSTKKYQLKPDDTTEMPMEHAMQFLKDVNFVVTDADNRRIAPLPAVKDGGIGGMKLEPGETVAHLTELTTTALFKRCKANPYSTDIDQDSNRESLIEFLMAAPRRNIGSSNVDVAAAFSATGGQMTAAELSKSLGDAPLFG